MRTKANLKKSNAARKTKTKSEDDEEEVIQKKTISKPIEVEEDDPIIETDKAQDDSLAEGEDIDDGDDAGLNEEDLDPFGDKWEQ